MVKQALVVQQVGAGFKIGCLLLLVLLRNPIVGLLLVRGVMVRQTKSVFVVSFDRSINQLVVWLLLFVGRNYPDVVAGKPSSGAIASVGCAMLITVHCAARGQLTSHPTIQTVIYSTHQ